VCSYVVVCIVIVLFLFIVNRQGRVAVVQLIMQITFRCYFSHIIAVLCTPVLLFVSIVTNAWFRKIVCWLILNCQCFLKHMYCVARGQISTVRFSEMSVHTAVFL